MSLHNNFDGVFRFLRNRCLQISHSMSVVAMVNSTAINNHDTSNVTVDSCPINASDATENLAPQGFLPPAHSVLAANWYPSTERGFLNAIVMAGSVIGSLISCFSAGALCASSFLGGWPSVYYIYGALGLILCLWVQMSMYESPRVHPSIKDEELNYILQNQETDLSQNRPPNGLEENFHICTFLCHDVRSFFSLLGNNTINLSASNISWKDITLLNSRDCLGYSLGLLGVYFAACDRMWSNILSITATSFIGLSAPGCMVVPMDMSPTFAGSLFGLSNTIASTASFILPVIVGLMINEDQTLEQWNKIFMLCIGVVMSSGIIFWIFGSAEVQPWNFTDDEQDDEKCSKESSKKNKLENPEHFIDSVTHL
ncbi:vesicular glutamate transporter 3 [Caerostris extrusa]|uniref:Vesicular glutamate transporter 3 n=1 Tax=Caerostris extrusa TaxID=172846 RepID=A0AAV4VNT0_CAEEX|nr:vesicular glutamate transporter 3 [Caerostris extrusa]